MGGALPINWMGFTGDGPARPLEAMLQRKQAPPPAKLQRTAPGEPAPDPKAALTNLMKARAATDGGAGAAGAPLRDHPAMKPFVKLLRVGLPKGAVARKMAEDGLDASLLDKDLDAPPDADHTRTQASKDTGGCGEFESRRSSCTYPRPPAAWPRRRCGGTRASRVMLH